MGRSKFPGKPSKQINRKRVNVYLSNEVESCSIDDVDVDEQKSTKVEDENPNNDKIEQPVIKRPPDRFKKKKHHRNIAKSKLMSHLCNKTIIKSSLKKKNKKHKYSPLKTTPQGSLRESNGIGKFVLPSRSVHSSRLIKPNKRFIDINESIRKNLNANETATAKVKTADRKLCTNNRIILRQAKFQFHTNQTRSEGPFSSTSGSVSAGTVTCGVCGAVRFYRFVKQARKFNIYSCESCRKFISKIIKRQACKNATLVCHKGQGTCHVPPIVRSQQWKLIRCAYKARCPACWLKLCLRSFKMPQTLKNNLLLLLPPFMRNLESLATNNVPIFCPLTPFADKTESPEKPTRTLRSNVQTVPAPPVPTDLKKQKTDSKGPRVKHVCRSASIVLGQPVATMKDYKNDVFEDKKDKCKDKGKVENKNEVVESDFTDNENLEMFPLDMADNLSETIYRIPHLEGKSSNKKTGNDQLISLNFWEEVDSDRINQNGYFLISSERTAVPMVCFLCGSAGQESMLYCSICCDPYHLYCLEQNLLCDIEHYVQDSTWLCPKCIVCSECNDNDRTKITCRKCSLFYHPECLDFGYKSLKDEQKGICLNCQRCKDCGTDFTTPLGNLSFCKPCLQLRKKESCPMCQKCFRDDFSQVMECTNCRKWVHAECENLREEHYQFFKLLPESVDYVCNFCTKDSVPYWKRAIYCKFKSNLRNLVNQLSKHKTVKHVFKTTTKSSVYDLDFHNNNNLGTETKTNFLNKEFLNIKRKISLDFYTCLNDFNCDMRDCLSSLNSEQVLKIYKSMLHSVFSWFDENSVKTNFFQGISISLTPQMPPPIDVNLEDTRSCYFCKGIGDRIEESRLLYIGANQWVHVNCALWSTEIYEDLDGCLQNISTALTKCQFLKCSYCKLKGASISCSFNNCEESYHFICARNSNCDFFHNKTVFCSKHEILKKCHIEPCTDFAVNRPVYTEIRNDQLCEIEKVNFMVGSLNVTDLGKIHPSFSDSYDTVVPIGFSCSRLFWSTVEPWKLVWYYITTAPYTVGSNFLYVDKNFTIDHSLPDIDKKIKELNIWHKDLEKKKSVILDIEDDEEPHKDTDFLSPELTDAILKDLPHELLDGISVQDIIPKLMPFEDVELSQSENSNLEDSDNGKSSNSRKKSSDILLLQGIDKSKIQRSCSVTLSCKLDNYPAVKKRKVAPPRDKNVFLQLLQVDGNFDDELAPTDEPVTCDKCLCTYRTQLSYRRHLDNCELLCTSESDSEDVQEIQLDKKKNVVIEHSFNTLVEQKSAEVIVQNSEVMVSNVQQKPPVYQILLPNQAQENTYPLVQQNIPLNEMVNPMQALYEPINTIQPQIINNGLIQPITIGHISTPQLQQIECQQPVLQPVQFNNNPVILNSQNKMISTNNIINQMVAQTVPANNWVKTIDPTTVIASKTIHRSRNKTIIAKRSDNGETFFIPQESTPAPVILQHLPSTNFVSTFMDTFQPSQNLQYIAPMATPQIIQSQLVQIQNDNLINLMPQVQPTMVVQQPRVVESQLMLDQNGILSWTQPQTTIQPLYYGFETIVQNTVMQSQQFLPTTMPGVLTANSSYSTTTQVFQTSKLEPVLDVSSNNYVLVNSDQLINSQPIESSIKIAYPEPVKTEPNIIIPNINENIAPTMPTLPIINNTQPTQPVIQNIPCVQAIPTNVVTPTPKSFTASKRPMNRVLPMQTNVKVPIMKTEKVKDIEKPENGLHKQLMDFQKTLETKEFLEEIKSVKKTKLMDMPLVDIKPKINEIPPKKIQAELPENKIEFPIQNVFDNFADNDIKDFIEKPFEPEIKDIKPVLEPIEKVFPEENITKDFIKTDIFNNFIEDPLEKAQKENIEVEPLKLVLQKQSEDGTYKVGNLLKSPVQVAPLKPFKSGPQSPLAQIENLDKRKPEYKKEPKYEKKVKKPKENDQPKIVYTIETNDGFRCTSTSVTDLWKKVLESVQNARAEHNMPLLPESAFNMNHNLLGLKNNGLKYLIEQLPGISKCSKYKPSHYFSNTDTNLDDEYSMLHSHGTIRCAPHVRKDNPYDMFSWLSSKHRKPEDTITLDMDCLPRRGSVTSLPMAMRFRQLKLTSKYSVGVYRSTIHGRGLFCLRNIEAGEMVIEYAGEVIRSIVCDKREKEYNKKGIGCYMFRIDDNFVVDATLKGNAARFINHSCEPNCYSKVVEILGHKHIIIFALRRIFCNEELTYDYKFPFEEDKIPCTCGTKRCRKFLN